MAKDKKPGKFQFVYINLEGDDETLQEALHQVGVVLNRGVNSAPRTLIAVPVQKALQDESSDGDSPQQVYEIVDEEAVITDTETNATGSPPATSKPKKPKKAPPTPPLLKGFDPNSPEMPFIEFVKHKDLSTNFNKYLVIATWFKRYKNTDQITPSHIYTCYQFMKWKAPNNMSQPFWDMKKLRNYFDKGSGPNAWEITIIGLNEVDKMKSTGGGED